jgi:hypothetical protein
MLEAVAPTIKQGGVETVFVMVSSLRTELVSCTRFGEMRSIEYRIDVEYVGYV